MKLRLMLAACALLLAKSAFGQAPFLIYSNGLLNDFQNWSWATNNTENTSPVYEGEYSISVTASNYSAFWAECSDMDTSPYTNLSFWINGGSSGGQTVWVAGVNNGNSLGSYTISSLPKNTWKNYVIPLSTLGVSNITDCNGFWWQLNSPNAAPTFYLIIQLNPVPAPSLINVTVNATQAIRTADVRWFGINTADWDGYLDDAETISEIQEAGLTTLRFPGGSESDEYNWATDTTGTNTWTWATSFTQFARVATNIHAQVILTANYGTGTPAEAAAWVAFSNVTNKYGFKYWEIGNELYGTWETDSNTYPNDPYTYATRAQSYIQQMKAADPTIKVGVVVTGGEDSYSNGYANHPATNMSTGQVHYGWTPVLLSRLKSLGVTPDFAIFHWYPQSGSDDDDATLLSGTVSWTPNAANLRYMISNYFGPGGTNIELLCTENNSDSGPMGKQSVSLVNALYYADSFGQLMQTEFNSYLWWDLRNGQETDGDMDPSLYGWRMYGDLGVMNGQATDLPDRYPPYFSAKLMQYFVRGGDTVLSASSSYSLLSAYAVRRTNGTLTLLVINKDLETSLTTQIALNGFTPSPQATMYSYGTPQDNAAESGIGSCDIAQTNFSAASTNFTCAFAPYSLTVLVFNPVAPSLAVSPSQTQPDQAVLQLAGQTGETYILQTSTNLASWVSVSTNALSTSPVNITNILIPGTTEQFWRAVWIP